MIVGIDPGITGAVAFHEPTQPADSGLRWIVFDMPVVNRLLNPVELRHQLLMYRPTHCWLEFTTSHPRDGRMGAFRLGGMFFGIRAVLACCEIPYTMVTPSKWKRHYHLRGGDKQAKESSRLRAIELFPPYGQLLARKKDHGRAEAMLIAHYGSKGGDSHVKVKDSS